MNTINLKFLIEKKDGHGEDSDPLFLVKGDFCAVGVFDGMGGSGAGKCKSDFGDGHTKAYVASRIIEESVYNYMNYAKSTSEICAERIKDTAKSRLEQEKHNFPLKVSGLRSKLVREYPTTLAVVTCEQKVNGDFTINSYWAGDSRNYLWNSDGFFQISKDDLDTELDPMENLRNDGVLSNCVCADREFEINSRSITVSKSFIILSATDGCFGYFPTPMHFHEVLLAGLKSSKDKTEWENYIKKEICNVTGDDISLSLCAIGYNDFHSLKESFEHEKIEGFDEMEDLRKEIDNIKNSIEQKKEALEEKMQSEWNSYKANYMKYINTAEHEVASNEESTKDVIDDSKGVSANDVSSVGLISENTIQEHENSIDDATKTSYAEVEHGTLKSEEEIQTLITKFKEEPSESIAKQLMNHVEMLSSKIKEMIEPFLKS